MDRLLEIENEDHFEKDYEMVIAVSAIEPETPVILQAPDEIKGIFDGLFCKDNAFYGVPDKPGVYNCTVHFEFHQGYFEGYRADGESDWSFTVKTASLVAHEIFKELEEAFGLYSDGKNGKLELDMIVIKPGDYYSTEDALERYQAIKSKYGVKE